MADGVSFEGVNFEKTEKLVVPTGPYEPSECSCGGSIDTYEVTSNNPSETTFMEERCRNCKAVYQKQRFGLSSKN